MPLGYNFISMSTSGVTLIVNSQAKKLIQKGKKIQVFTKDNKKLKTS